MTLRETMDSSIKDAMRARDTNRLTTLRAIKSLILLEATSGNSADGISEETEMKILVKAAKQRKEAAEIFKTQNRDDLYTKEMAELAVIEEFLPKALSEDELKVKLQEIMSRVGASAPSDLGKVMGVASKELAGLADGKAISAMVKSLLQ